jgi:hypothetical protein
MAAGLDGAGTEQLTPVRRTGLLVAGVVWLLTSHLDARAQTWTKHTYTTDGFEVEFSGDMKVTPVALSPDVQSKVVRSTEYQQDGGTYVYAVAASLNRDGVNFDGGVKSSFAAMKCKVMTRDAPLDSAVGRGRELRGTDCHAGAHRAEARYFTVGN